MAFDVVKALRGGNEAFRDDEIKAHRRHAGFEDLLEGSIATPIAFRRFAESIIKESKAGKERSVILIA